MGPRQCLEERAAAELRVCSSACERYGKNYYGWLHRAWVLETLGGAALLPAELAFARAWAQTHVGDTCGYSHRAALLLRVAAAQHGGLAGRCAGLRHQAELLLQRRLTSPTPDPALNPPLMTLSSADEEEALQRIAAACTVPAGSACPACRMLLEELQASSWLGITGRWPLGGMGILAMRGLNDIMHTLYMCVV